MKTIESNCIFCDIVTGKAESSKIYEDEHIIALMNIRPVNAGEFLIIPKIHIDHFIDLPSELACHILLTAQTLSNNLMKTLKPLRIGYLVHGFGVPHAHLNVIPLNSPNDIVSIKQLKIINEEIIDDITLLPQPTRSELDKIASELKNC
ncbi:MAG TPA: HIT family protein [Ignavibacteria bacterium]|nr:HIT family protein [Ignavibacteria bacterium]HMQ99239.1 HIT family protein [Ignavibacteria bacterium]